jgi:hypothetical protein
MSAIAFVAMLVVVLGTAACGQRFDRDAAASAPVPADLAADALQALEEAGSAHFVADLKAGPTAESESALFTAHLEGEASAQAVDAEGSVALGPFTVNGHLLVGEHSVFAQVMEQWYGDNTGIADELQLAQKQHEGRVWNELATPEGLRRNFAQLVDGEVTEGPTLDGAATWQFRGRLDATGVMGFAKRLGIALDPRERELFAKVANASAVLLVVGQDDQLPRRVEFSIHLSADELRELRTSGFSSTDGAENFSSSLELSDFAKPVHFQQPAGAKPLDQLFEELLAGFE